MRLWIAATRQFLPGAGNLISMQPNSAFPAARAALRPHSSAVLVTVVSGGRKHGERLFQSGISASTISYVDDPVSLTGRNGRGIVLLLDLRLNRAAGRAGDVTA